ncbi:hypothetical protein [Bifidobacterium criceti]|nr:hypothetical protein [Bifidobacterium criceti]
MEVDDMYDMSSIDEANGFANFIDYYAFLGVGVNATDEQIEQACKEKTDHFNSMDASDARFEALRDLREIRSKLTVPVSRRSYDEIWRARREKLNRRSGLKWQPDQGVRGDYERAVALFDHGEYRRALAYLEAAARADGGRSPEIPFLMGRCYGELSFKEWPQAYACMAQALQYAQRNQDMKLIAPIYAWMGNFSNQNQEERIRCYTEAANAEPDSPIYAISVVNRTVERKLEHDEDLGAEMRLIDALYRKYPNAQCVKNQYAYLIYLYITNTIANEWRNGTYEFTTQESVDAAKAYFPFLDSLGSVRSISLMPCMGVTNEYVNQQIGEMRQKVEEADARLNRPSLFKSLRSRFGRH